MSVLFTRRDAASFGSLIPPRGSDRFGRRFSTEEAMRQGVVWAATRLRADMISTLPIDVYRKVEGLQVEVPKPPILRKPNRYVLGMREWLYSTQMDLDRVGNCFGIITAVDGTGLPREIELVAAKDVTIRSKDGVITYRIGTREYAAEEIWHERQHTVPGLFPGLSPIAHAALALGIYQSANELATEWFRKHGTRSGGHLRNKEKTLDARESAAIKDRYRLATEDGDLFVFGADWELSFADAGAADLNFLTNQDAAALDICRYFGVPGDLIDLSGKGSSITYANVTQRNLQFLVLNLQPAVTRREDALSALLPAPRFVKLNTDALLRMDPKGMADKFAVEIKARITTPSEARALMNRAPLTPEQISEFASLFPKDFATAGRS